MGLTDSDAFDIHYTTVDDLRPLTAWLKTEGMLHWYPPGDDKELDNFVRIWGGFARYNASITATLHEKPVGMATLYLMPYRKVAHHCLFQIVVDPEHFRQGIGTALVRNLKHLAKNYFRLELIHAEILDENPATIALLSQQNFVEFARQESYVKENGNYYPRILMECEL